MGTKSYLWIFIERSRKSHACVIMSFVDDIAEEPLIMVCRVHLDVTEMQHLADIWLVICKQADIWNSHLQKKSSPVLDNSPTICHNPSLDKRLKVFTQKWPIFVKVFTQKITGTFVKGRGIQQLSIQCPCQLKHFFFSLSRISTKNAQN